MTVLLKQRCRKCKLELLASHFRPGRKTCITCLDGVPYIDVDYIVIPRPRAVRRKWPKFVLAHKPQKRYNRDYCWICGKPKGEDWRKNQRLCGDKSCRAAYKQEWQQLKRFEKKRLQKELFQKEHREQNEQVEQATEQATERTQEAVPDNRSEDARASEGRRGVLFKSSEDGNGEDE